MKRQIIKIDEDKCTGCGLCVTGCPEGALQIVDDKAKLVGELLCDGLGACIGDCPEGAITVETREAEPYDERLVMENVHAQGLNVVKAHLEHLVRHNQDDHLTTARAWLKEKGLDDPSASAAPSPTISAAPSPSVHTHGSGGGCPGSRAFTFANSPPPAETGPIADTPSQLNHWPVQMHLLSPAAPHYREADLLLAADCVAFSLGDFHEKLLKGRTLAIACPKLDQALDIYLNKLVSLIDEARINTLTVAVMEVPCCSGLVRLAREAVNRASRKVPVRQITVGIRGDILKDEWMG